jgi:ABC-type taurine transport system ATPase subunit
LTVQENMELDPKLEGIPKAERQQIADKYLDPVGLAPHRRVRWSGDQ